MENFNLLLPQIMWGACFIVFWFIIRRILKSYNNRITNNEVYHEDTIAILEEIRDELKELNKNNLVK